MERADLYKLNKQIEELREEMHRSYSIQQKNINNPKTYRLSLKLDRLILKLMKVSRGRSC